MKRFFLVFLLITVGVSELTDEKYWWIVEIADWKEYLMYLGWAGRLDRDVISSRSLVLMPFLAEHPHATLEYDKLVAESMSAHKGLDWALDSLRSKLDPLLELPDSLRRKMIFYLYLDRLRSLKKPLTIKYFRGKRDFYIYDGTGTPDKGFLQVACLTGVCDGFEYGGPLIVSWAATGDTVMDSTRAVQMFRKACEEGVIVSPSTDPQWRPLSRVVRCAYPFYGRPAYHIVATVEYETEFRVRQATRETFTFYIFVLEKGGYEYLISFLGGGGCFNVENLADFLSLRP